jgi:hypothetical protein
MALMEVKSRQVSKLSFSRRKFGLCFRLRVTGKNQPAPIHRGNPNVDYLNAHQLLEHGQQC